MTRIAYVCTDPGVPVFGRKGCSVHVQEVIRALRRAGCDVELFARSSQGQPPADLVDVRVHALTTPDGLSGEDREQALLAGNDDLRRALDAAGALDLVYERYSLWSHSAMEWAAMQAVPGLLEINAPLIEEQIQYRRLFGREAAEESTRRALGSASAIAAVSLEVADHFQRYAEAVGRVEVVPNGVDINRFGPHVKPDIPADPGGACTFGFVGTLKPWHGVEHLIDAAARVPGARLLVVGDGPELNRLKQLAAQRGMGDAAIFTGAVDPGRVPGLVASMDAAVAPYPRLDGFYFSPLKILEYMASGRAIVSSDIGQISQLLVHEQTALLTEPGNVEALAANLQRVRDDAGLRHRMGQNARHVAVRSYSWDGVATRLLAIARVTARGHAAASEAPA